VAKETRVKFSTTLIFSFLFIVVAVVYFGLKPSPVSERAAPLAVTDSLDLLGLSPSDRISWIQIQNLSRKETMTLIPQGEQWMIKYPVYYPAKKEDVEAMVRMILSAKKVRQLVPDKDWEEYGLLNPPIKIGLETAESPKRRYLYLGAGAALGDSIFARWEGEKEYFLLPADVKQIFDRSVYALREKRVFRIPFSQVSKIEFEIESSHYELVKRKEKWTWIKPREIQGMALDEASAAALVSQIQNLFVKDFLDPETGKSDLSFFKPLSTVKIWGQGKETEVFMMGQEAPVRDAFYAKREGEEVLLLIDRNNLLEFFETVKDIAGASIIQVKTNTPASQNLPIPLASK